jgi:2'-5' RNA ligase
MANQLQWQIGHEGKGNYYPDGSVQTWNVNELSEPHHDEAAIPTGMSPAFRFYISPEGGLHDGGIGFTNGTGRPDNDVVRDVAGRTPGVWDGRGQVFDDFSVTPRVEDGYGSYGHAENLIPRWNEQGTYAKFAKEEGWADFHTELKLPLSARRKIRKWVDRLKWPEGSSKDDTRRYHITILSMDEYDEDFAKWAKQQMRGKKFRFESTGMDIFADEHVVLRLKCPEWTAIVREWTAKAKEEGLEPHVFDPPKAHVTLGKSPSGKWPQGIPDPHVKFETATFNINKNSSVQWASGDGVCDNCGAMQIGVDVDDQIGTDDDHIVCRECGSFIPVENAPKHSSWKVAETTPAEELLSWVQTQTPQEQSTPLSIHHTSPEQLLPQTQAPIVQTPHIDPPKQPYSPYNWADNGFEESPLNMTSNWQVTEAFGTHPCPECEQQIEGQICPHCGYDPQHSQSDFERAENEWYDRAWSEPGNQPRPVPHQPLHYGPKDHATDVRFATADLDSTSYPLPQSDQPDNNHIADNEPQIVQSKSLHLANDEDRESISDVESSRESSIFDVPSQQSDEIPGWASKGGWRLLN